MVIESTNENITGNQPYNAATIFSGPSEMHRRIRELNWTKTPVGPVENWPQSLKSMVKTLLASRYPMGLVWGPQMTQFYNDAYSKLIGNKHPAALGMDIRITLAEGWDALGPVIEEVMRTGNPSWIPELLLILERAGYLEEAYFSVSHAPAENDDGEIVGMFWACSEVTQQVFSERRLRLLRDLSFKAGETRNVEAICADMAIAIAEHPLDVPFALIYLREPDGKTLTLKGKVGLEKDASACPAIVSWESNTHAIWPFREGISGKTVLVKDVHECIQVLGGPINMPVQSALIMPITSTGKTQPLGIIIVGISPNCALDEGYRSFYELLAGQVSIAVCNAKAYEEERGRAERLAELDRAKTEFFNNVSHEFRTPLTLMLGPLEELLNDASPFTSKNRSQLNIAYRNTLRLLKLVNTLLEFSCIEAGRIEAHYQPTDLAAYTHELASIFRTASEKAGLTLTLECYPFSEPVYVDREMWEKIVLNLLSNAFKFTCEGGITVRLLERNGQALLKVQDTGCGIAPEHSVKIFDRFYRAKNVKSRTHEGTGIGLALVRELVQLHGGRVEVQSTLNEGSVFTVSIPTGQAHLPLECIRANEVILKTPGHANLYVEEVLHWLPQKPDEIIGNPIPFSSAPSLLDSSELESTVSNQTKRQRILLADDNADMLAYIERLLSPFYTVTTVADGKAALEAIQQDLPDLLLSDVMMPGLDGFELLQAIRANFKTRALPVILLSARAGEGSSIEGLEAGADDYLIKPFNAQELMARIRSNLEMARLRQETEKALREAQKTQMIGQLAGGVAHDFNSLLTVIIGNLQLLDNQTDDQNSQKMLRSALRAAERGGKLTKQLLAFAQKQRLQPEPINLNTLIFKLNETLKLTLGSNIQYHQNLENDLWPALADPNQLELIISNLALNARDAMPNGGIFTIETRNESITIPIDDLATGNYVLLSISDTGIGMSEEILAKAFEPFFTTKGIGQGTGLGLSQTYGSSRQLGGTTRIKSVLNVGTTIEVLLPRACIEAVTTT